MSEGGVSHEVTISSEYTGGVQKVNTSWTLRQFQEKLEFTTGIPPSGQVLSVYDQNGQSVAFKPEESLDRQLSEIFGISGPYWRVHVEDSRPKESRLNLDEPVDKYEMPLDQYDKRENSVKEWKRQHNLGRFSKDQNTESNSRSLQDMHESADHLQIGQTGYVHLANGNKAKGTIAYIGKIPEIPGKGVTNDWLGVVLEAAEGRNDGSVQGTRYFTAEPNHGVFILPSKFEVNAMVQNNEEDEL